MPAVIEYKTTVDATSIYAMRYSGATLDQIADRVGRTKERIRQILIHNYGSTKHKLVSTRQLCKLSGLSRNRIMQFHQDNVINPVREWDTSSGRRSLWSLSAVEKVIINSLTSSRTDRLCRICHGPVPVNRHRYCSDKCYKESHKYKYRSIEARQRHSISVKRYRTRCKQSSQEKYSFLGISGFNRCHNGLS